MNPVEVGATVKNDLISSLCGDFIGGGIARKVYVYEMDESKVIKIEDTAQSFQNIIEWETWKALKDTPHAKWLAPCRFISKAGTVLLMDRTTPMREGEEPQEMPRWLSDHKRANYGMLAGQAVCHDYGTNLLLNHGAFTKRMQKVQWW